MRWKIRRMDALINPVTGGYAGTRTVSLENAVYFRLQTPLGTYWRDPTIGSLLYTLARSKDLPNVDVLAVQYAEQALQPLLDNGRASSITVTSTRPRTGWLMLNINVVDATGGTLPPFQHWVKVI
jgi:phage gp46-like protein